LIRLGFELGLHACKTSTLLLEPHLLSKVAFLYCKIR
jgi:hypothetical protein